MSKKYHTYISDKIAYAISADPDQTAPSSLIGVYTVCHSLFEKQDLGTRSISISKFRTFTVTLYCNASCYIEMFWRKNNIKGHNFERTEVLINA